MNDDHKELIEYLDHKFSGVDDQLEELRKNFHEMLSAMDAYAKKADMYFQEMLMLANKVDRHDKWLHQIAEKLGVKLDY